MASAAREGRGSKASDADIAGPADQIVHDRTVNDLEPACARRFADHDLRHVVGLRIGDDVFGDAAIAAW
jgi:hypothetical protein